MAIEGSDDDALALPGLPFGRTRQATRQCDGFDVPISIAVNPS